MISIPPAAAAAAGITAAVADSTGNYLTYTQYTTPAIMGSSITTASSSKSSATGSSSIGSSSTFLPSSADTRPGIPPVTNNDLYQPPCTLNPCQNNGICIPNGYSFICNCQAGFSGDFCEQPVATQDFKLGLPPFYPKSVENAASKIVVVAMQPAAVTVGSSTSAGGSGRASGRK